MRRGISAAVGRFLVRFLATSTLPAARKRNRRLDLILAGRETRNAVWYQNRQSK